MPPDNGVSQPWLDIPATGGCRIERIGHKADWISGPFSMSGHDTEAPALFQKLGSSTIGAGLFIVFAPVHLLVSEEISVAIAAVTLALIGGTYIGFGASAKSMRTFWLELGGACRVALDSACLATGRCSTCCLGRSSPQRRVWRASSEMVYFILRRFRSACCGFSLCSVSPVRCVQ